MSRSALLAVAVITLLAAQARANDGWYVGFGAPAPFGKSHPTIQMLTEDLRIVMDDRGSNVEVRYVFKNHGKATKVTMGFPEKRSNVAGPGIDRLESWLDGKPVSVRRKSLAADYENSIYSVVWLKEVAFGTRQSRRVRIRYRIEHSGSTSGDLSFTYILATANSWRDPIADFRASYDWSRMRKVSKPIPDIYGFATEPWRVTGAKSRAIHLRNFRPGGSLSLDMRLGFWNFQLNAKRLDVPRGIGAEVSTLGSGSDVRANVELVEKLLDVDIEDNRCFRNDSVDPANKLRRKVAWDKSLAHWHDKMQFVYLRDVMQAIGGTYRYDRKTDLVRLQIPGRKRN